MGIAEVVIATTLLSLPSLPSEVVWCFWCRFRLLKWDDGYFKMCIVPSVMEFTYVPSFSRFSVVSHAIEVLFIIGGHDCTR